MGTFVLGGGLHQPDEFSSSTSPVFHSQVCPSFLGCPQRRRSVDDDASKPCLSKTHPLSHRHRHQTSTRTFWQIACPFVAAAGSPQRWRSDFPSRCLPSSWQATAAKGLVLFPDGPGKFLLAVVAHISSPAHRGLSPADASSRFLSRTHSAPGSRRPQAAVYISPVELFGSPAAASRALRQRATRTSPSRNQPPLASTPACVLFGSSTHGHVRHTTIFRSPSSPGSHRLRCHHGAATPTRGSRTATKEACGLAGWCGIILQQGVSFLVLCAC